MLIGPCGAGKTSLLNGLMQKSLTVANSTQLVDSMAITSLVSKILHTVCNLEL